MVKEAIQLSVEFLVADAGRSVDEINDAGCMVYSANQEYKDFDSWFMIEVDLSNHKASTFRCRIC